MTIVSSLYVNDIPQITNPALFNGVKYRYYISLIPGKVLLISANSDRHGRIIMSVVTKSYSRCSDSVRVKIVEKYI